MDGVHGVLQDLEPVARVVVPLSGHHTVSLPLKGIKEGKIRNVLRGTHVGEDNALKLLDRVCAVAEPILEGAAGGLTRRFKNGAVDIEEPSVIAAADSAL